MKKHTGIILATLSLLVLLSPQHIAKASEVIGNLSTGIGGTVGNTIEGTVVVPTPVIQSSGGGGGGSSSSSRSSGTPTVTAQTSVSPVAAAPIRAGQVLGASTYNFTSNLSVGSQGSEVNALQRMLIDGGYLSITAPTGYFGALTKIALAKYQTAHGIDPVGYVGPLTRKALNIGVVSSVSQQDTASLIASLMAQVKLLQAQLAVANAL